MARAAHGQVRPSAGSTDMYRSRTGEPVRSIHASWRAVTPLPSGEGVSTAAVLYALTRYPHMRLRPRHGARRILAWTLEHGLNGDVSSSNGRARTLDPCFIVRGHAHAVGRRASRRPPSCTRRRANLTSASGHAIARAAYSRMPGSADSTDMCRACMGEPVSSVHAS